MLATNWSGTENATKLAGTERASRHVHLRDDNGAKKFVTGILTRFDWSTIDLGGIEGARMLEPLAMP
jgi:predicted dinucleotide-binding enzyme